ncbi:MAG: DUF6455 family protein [Hyphomicrobiaceae bacterium]
MSRPMVNHVAQRERRLEQMLEWLGVDASRLRRDLHGATFEMASWNCVRCAHPNACQEWFDSLARGPMIPPHFCPNCDLLRSHIPQR